MTAQETAQNVLRRHFARLAHEIYNPLVVATEFFANEIVSQSLLGHIRDVRISNYDKNTLLLAAVFEQIAGDPGRFETFLTILNRDVPLRPLVESMKTMWGRPRHLHEDEQHPRGLPTSLENTPRITDSPRGPPTPPEKTPLITDSSSGPPTPLENTPLITDSPRGPPTPLENRPLITHFPRGPPTSLKNTPLITDSPRGPPTPLENTPLITDSPRGPPTPSEPSVHEPQPSVTSPVSRSAEFDERPTIQEFQSLIWKDGDRTEEIRIMDEIKSRWRDFGIALGFSLHALESIEVGGLRMPDHCIQSVFGEWQRKMSSTYHWKGLIAALNKAGFTDLATRVTYAVQNPQLPSTLGELWNHPQLKPFVLQNPKPTGRVLGTGVYGSVEEVEIDRTVCAGKKFRHDDISHNEGRFCRTFTREYACISKLRHKHIVQYRGICSLPDSKLPVLVMERLETNLHKYLLNPDNANLDLAVKVSILRGIAKGLIYLHNQTPVIIHRDLTAKNVLLDSKLVPKISDFGNSRIFDIDPSSALETMSNVPGTLLYMPPEALVDDARYNTKLDIFSYGHLALFTATQIFPCSLLPSTYYNKVGGKRRLEARTEVERRKECFDKLGDQHPLTNLIEQCLDNEPEERPKATAIETRLDELRRSLRTK